MGLSARVKGIRMTTRVIGIALIAGCCWLGGCATGKAVDRDSPGDRQVLTEVSTPADARTEARTVPAESKEPGKPIEVIEERWPDGNLKVRREVRRDEEGNAIPHGTTVTWWEDGQKKTELSFVDGVKHGPRIAWYRNGQMWSEGTYDHGEPSGTWTLWYSDDAVQRVWHYDANGAYHGMFEDWYEEIQSIGENA